MNEDRDCEILDGRELEEITDVVPVEDVEEEVMDVLPAEEEEDDPARRSRLLSLPKIFVKGDKGFDLVGRCSWVLYNPQSHKRVGRALEVQDSGATAARMILGVGRSIMPTTLEVREGRGDRLVLSVSRPTRVGASCLEVYDGDGELLGSAEYNLANLFKGDARWVRDADGRKCMRILEPRGGRWFFQDRDDQLLGEFVMEAIHLNKIKVYVLPKGGSYYAIFQPCLADRPRDKMLILGVGLGMDLYRSER